MLGAPEYNAPVMIVWTSKVALWADRGPVFCCQDFPHERNHMAGGPRGAGKFDPQDPGMW